MDYDTVLEQVLWFTEDFDTTAPPGGPEVLSQIFI
jgi:hypothetical protein